MEDWVPAQRANYRGGERYLFWISAEKYIKADIGFSLSLILHFDFKYRLPLVRDHLPWIQHSWLSPPSPPILYSLGFPLERLAVIVPRCHISWWVFCCFLLNFLAPLPFEWYESSLKYLYPSFLLREIFVRFSASWCTAPLAWKCYT